MMDLSKRSYQKELLDGDDVPFAAIERNMQELDLINTWLGGHAISLSGLKLVAGNRKQLTICEIGSGGGDNLRVLYHWCRKKNITVQVTGIDSNAHCIQVAREKWQGDDAHWIHADYREVAFTNGKPDIIFSSLFCHHFKDEELVFLFQWMDSHAGVGWFINDLQRHPLAYYSIRQLTKWFSRSYLVKNDAPLSVLRGFSRRELETLLLQAGIDKTVLRWKWAFRWLVTRSLA